MKGWRNKIADVIRVEFDYDDLTEEEIQNVEIMEEEFECDCGQKFIIELALDSKGYSVSCPCGASISVDIVDK